MPIVMNEFKINKIEKCVINSTFAALSSLSGNSAYATNVTTVSMTGSALFMLLLRPAKVQHGSISAMIVLYLATAGTVA